MANNTLMQHSSPHTSSPLSVAGSAYIVSVLIKELSLWFVNQRLVGGGVHRWW